MLCKLVAEIDHWPQNGCEGTERAAENPQRGIKLIYCTAVGASTQTKTLKPQFRGRNLNREEGQLQFCRIFFKSL